MIVFEWISQGFFFGIGIFGCTKLMEHLMAYLKEWRNAQDR